MNETPRGVRTMSTIEEAQMIAAQCWCDKETEHITMIPELAEAIAKRIHAILSGEDSKLVEAVRK